MTKAGPTTKSLVLAQSPQSWRPAVKKAFSAVARLPVLSHSCEESSQCWSKAPRAVQCCEESLQCGAKISVQA